MDSRKEVVRYGGNEVVFINMIYIMICGINGGNIQYYITDIVMSIIFDRIIMGWPYEVISSAELYLLGGNNKV